MNAQYHGDQHHQVSGQAMFIVLEVWRMESCMGKFGMRGFLMGI